MIALLLRPICFAAYQIFVVRHYKRPVNIFVYQAKALIQIQRNSDGIGGKILAITLDFIDIIRDDDFTNLACKFSVGVDGLETKHQVQYDVV